MRKPNAPRGVLRLLIPLAAAFLLPCLAPLQAAPAPECPATGDTIIYGTIGEPGNLLPNLSSDSASSEVKENFYVSLLRYGKNLNVEALAAEKYEILEDGKLFRFTLKKGIRWQDGTELTAEDVEFTYKTMINPETPTAYAGDWQAIQSFTVSDRYSFEVRYAEPFARAVNTWMGEIMPKHALEGKNLRESPLARAPLSCGPYLFKEWIPGASVTLAANPDYFKGRPCIDRIVYRVIPDLTTMFLELKAGKIDVMASLTPLQYEHQTKDPAFAGQYNTYRTLGSSYTYMGFNLKSPLFSDKKIRLALAHAVDKREVIKGALLGQGEPTVGPYKPGTWPYNSAIQEYPYDKEKALALLAEAGWKKDEDGKLRKDGKRFAFTLLVNQGNDQRIKTAVIIQDQLKEIGIDVTIRSVEWAAFLSRFVNPGNFDAVILAWTIPLDPDAFDVWHSSRAGGGLNFINFKNAEADKLLEQGRVILDETKRKPFYDKFQEVLHEEQPYLFLYVPYVLTAVHKRFQGIEPAPAGIFYNTDRWWVAPADQLYRTLP